MKRFLRMSVRVVLIAAFTVPVAADDPEIKLQEKLQQVLDDPDLSGLERFQALRKLIDAEESAFVSENVARWVSELGGADFDSRREAQEQLAVAGVLALPALEEGVRTGNLEASTRCLQLIDRLARTELHSETAFAVLERLADDDDETVASRAEAQLAAHAERTVEAAVDRIERAGGRVTFDRRSHKVRRVMFFNGGGVDDSMVECLATLTDLDSLHLHDARITDGGLRHLLNLRSLRNLSLDGTPITDEGLEVISKLTSLQDLSIAESEVSDAGLKRLMELKILTDLSLMRTAITDAGLMHLIDHPSLNKLSLGLGGKITDDGLQHLQRFPHLKTLTLGADFSDRGAQHLAGITTLERLAFINCQGLTDAGLRHLSNVTTLKKLSIYSRSGGVTDAGLKELQQALPDLETSVND